MTTDEIQLNNNNTYAIIKGKFYINDYPFILSLTTNQYSNIINRNTIIEYDYPIKFGLAVLLGRAKKIVSKIKRHDLLPLFNVNSPKELIIKKCGVPITLSLTDYEI